MGTSGPLKVCAVCMTKCKIETWSLPRLPPLHLLMLGMLFKQDLFLIRSSEWTSYLCRYMVVQESTRGDPMDDDMMKLQQAIIDIETNAEHLLLARHELVENDKARNGNREALTALRKKARTTKTSVPSPFESIMKDVGAQPRLLVKEICPTCGDHDPREHTWVMFPGSDIFARVPFHAAHSILEKDQEQLDYAAKKLQSYVKEKSLIISEKGALDDRISPGVLKSLVTLTDKSK